MNTLHRFACAALCCALNSSAAQGADPANAAAVVPPTIYQPVLIAPPELASTTRPDQAWPALNRALLAHPAMKMDAMPAPHSAPMPEMKAAPTVSTPAVHVHPEAP